jgi:hypothetical protein
VIEVKTWQYSSAQNVGLDLEKFKAFENPFFSQNSLAAFAPQPQPPEMHHATKRAVSSNVFTCQVKVTVAAWDELPCKHVERKSPIATANARNQRAMYCPLLKKFRSERNPATEIAQ